jgi:hypothetical protein
MTFSKGQLDPFEVVRERYATRITYFPRKVTNAEKELNVNFPKMESVFTTEKGC